MGLIVMGSDQSEAALPCVICGHELEQAVPEARNQPAGGTAFTSTGHYGSGVFDPGWSSSVHLEVNFCDACLLRAAGDGRVLHGTERLVRNNCDYKSWLPPAARNV